MTINTGYTYKYNVANIFELNINVQYIRLSDGRPYFIMPAALYPFLIMSIPVFVLK